ncbi:MAG: zinc-dependent alcohol dehydrogenase family protein [Anaerolineae bacterium]|uniref:zinc-dependent alcohol dehydrogenase family protein n=1 Tax=Promineifilum sp. TaxID=2664178 RepID=UPI001D420A44|nr:zinc-dependent alcohol dehydrogenase family protein [Anaerolineales bacterium]MCB8933850.1 zinc-dependent alcohol dehydrogenase family protein [Promineifilum sp.]MCO5181397.1 zinc-dependent alcohol dehydrogenase family protein [Promineifilum sp.]MCW5846323.1 zinc-dependent alcohol dehydrogenase family protein [Anaerolineae bacterium]
MRALRFEKFGPPADVLHLEDLPLPQPRSNQVRLRLTHRPINPSDLLTISGEYGRLPRLPATPGFEAVGRVEALGDEVTGWNTGARVVPLTGGGTWCESIVVNAAALVPVPDNVSDQAAAQLIANPVTAWVMLEEELNLGPGDWVLQTAAGSTLGRLVIQLARLRGYRTINLVRRREQVDDLLALGADAVFATADGDVVARIKQVTDGRGASGALDAVGGEMGGQALRGLRPGGTMLIYGMLSGEPLPLHNGEMLFRGLTARGFWLTHWFQQTPPAQVAATLGALSQLMADGELVPPVEAEYDLAEFRAAMAHAERPGRQGKVLLTG